MSTTEENYQMKTEDQVVEMLKNRIQHFDDGMVTFDEMVMFLVNDLTSPEVNKLVEESRANNPNHDPCDDGSD
jgi:hypothetical protein